MCECMRIVSRVQFVHGVVGFLSGSSREACASRDHSLYFFFLQTFKISICSLKLSGNGLS